MPELAPPAAPVSADVRGRRVLLGVCGGIAAYKAIEVLRRLRDHGVEVRVAMTEAAKAFVQPLTFEVLSGHPVWCEDYLEATGRGTEEHIEATEWAELVCLVPATTHTLARAALGLGDDFLTTTLLAWDGPLVLVPAMHSRMWDRPTTRAHVAALSERGATFVGPVVGALASGESGQGRMAEPEAVVRAILRQLGVGSPLEGRRVLVSAGPTWEPVDPARFIGNRSSGKMGFAIAAEAAARGARVTLVAGPVRLATPAGVERVDVETAVEMREALVARAPSAELIVMTAAVADFRPRHRLERKIKKQNGPPQLDLVANPDILAELPSLAPQATIVGFAAETEDLAGGARRKLESKAVDMIVVNDVSREDIGFGVDDNEVAVYRRDGEPVFFGRQAKTRLAGGLLDLFGAALLESDELAAEASG